MMQNEQQLATPYGLARLELIDRQQARIALLRDEAAPHAAIYAAKELGAARVIELISAQPLDRLLEAGDLLVPGDLVDLTEQRRSTFFAHKGYGFISQHPVFCPEVRAALLSGARAAGARSFGRGALAVVEDWSQRQQARSWGAHLLAKSAAPAAYLAKELELCYTPLCLVGAACSPELLEQVLAAALAHLPATASCPCAQTMQPTRQRGLVGDNWKEWL